MEIEILKSLIGAIGGAAAIVLTAWFALSRFRSEKWWERKAETYASIFDAMDALIEEVDQLYDEEISHNTVVITPEYRTKLAVAAGEARRQIRRASRIGAFLLSDDAEGTLVILLNNLEHAKQAKSYFDHLDSNYGALKNALDVLKRQAKTDLGIDSPWTIQWWQRVRKSEKTVNPTWWK